MSDATTMENAKPATEADKLTSLFNEEIYIRMDASSIPASKFKIYDDILESYQADKKLDDAKVKIEEHLTEHPESISAKYLLMIISLITDSNAVQETPQLKNLLEQFRSHGKWVIIEYITDNIFKYDPNNKIALRYKAEALEKLKKNKELKPVLEKLAKLDRKNPEIQKKYGLSILEESKEEAIGYLKKAVEEFAKTKSFTALDEIWPIIVTNNYEDIAFIEKIERQFLAHREKQRLVTLLYPILEPYKSLEDWDKVILFLKKILDHEPAAQKARTELIRVYRKKYAEHSLLEHFLKISDLGNNRKPVKVCITNFERNIVFDTGNYVMHRNWGVGKIVSISENGDSIFVDFKDKKNHKLSIQMAITSLKPLKKDHIWVTYYENKDQIMDLFENDLVNFISWMVKSHDNAMTTGDLKVEMVGEFLKADEWSKWWQKVKQALKQDPNIGMNPKKKDELVYHEQKITHSDGLIAKFEATQDPFKRLDIALQAVKDQTESVQAADHFNGKYNQEELSKDTNRKIIAYLYLDQLDDAFTKPFAKEKASNPDAIPPLEVVRKISPAEISDIIAGLTKEECIQLSASISQLEIKKGLVDLIKQYHPKYVDIFFEILFEVPPKVTKHVWTLLHEDGKISELNLFLETICKKAKNFPEVFIWMMKAILNSPGSYDYLKFDQNDLVLRTLRILKPLGKIEPKGNKLKNQAHGILVDKGEPQDVLKEAIASGDDEYARKLYALYKEVSYITDSEKEKLLSLISELKPNLEWDEGNVSEDDDEDDILAKIPTNSFLVTRKAFNKKKSELEQMINVEMAENSRDIGEAQEKGDLRENAEYKAAMEKQTQIQAAIKKLDSDLKNALVLEDYTQNIKTEKIGIGCTAKLKNQATGEILSYSILGTWDADTSKNIISYQAPLAKTLLGKSVGDTAILIFGSQETSYTVLEIGRYSSIEH
ncbi:transcription elongation factor GreA [Leptospira sp. GIMC2001]|uniref:transcription elongation factor GreA n=1 Tax=Leptospira sp. GIMC2001 TaxID=1513297 RepID=UPI0023494959|nr:transcription elongation factor GreA [Leptospira sp. GIMC2001]WCL48649.1 transcription elongation factor GreA [Leptospira sp. GIMC2001]